MINYKVVVSVLAVLIFGIDASVGAAVTNDAAFINESWDGFTGSASTKNVYAGGDLANDIGWAASTGTSGTAPSVASGEATVSMVGATGGSSQIFTGNLNSYSSELFSDRYVITMRVRVDQFPDLTISGSPVAGRGILLVDSRRDFRLEVLVTPTDLWIYNGSSWTQIPLVTVAGTDYTWQFEVDDAGGIVDVYRRESDANAFNQIRLNVAIRSTGAADQLIFLRTNYNAENTQIQGKVSADYFQVGNIITFDRAAFIDENWNDFSGLASGRTLLAGGISINDIGWFASPGTGGTAPAVGNGTAVVSMEGASDGSATINTGPLDTYRADMFFDRYTVTMRVSADQFPDAIISSNAVAGKGIVLVDARRDFRLTATLTPTALWVDDGAAWAAIPVATLSGTFYTWKFEVDDVAGQVDIVRRTSDEDNYEQVATNVAIRNQTVTDQILFNVVNHNADNSQLQGVISADYFRVESTPEPALYVSFDSNLHGVNSQGTVFASANSGASIVASGVLGGAVQCSGAGYIEYSDVFTNASGSILFWVRPEGNDTAWPTLRYNLFGAYGPGAANNSANQRIRLFVDRLLRFSGHQEDSGPLQRDRFLGEIWPKGEWMHLGLVWDTEGGLQMYINGLAYQHGRNAAPKEMPRRGTGNLAVQDMQRIFLGSVPSTSFANSPAPISFDELKVFDVALSDRDVSTEYRRGMPVDMVVQRRYLRAGEAETVQVEISAGGKIATPRLGIAVPVPIATTLEMELRTLAGALVASQSVPVVVEQNIENISMAVGSLSAGSYRLTCRLPWEGAMGQRIFPIEVYAPQLAAVESDAPLELGALLGSIDCSLEGQGFVASGPTQVLTVPGVGTYREAGADDFDRFSYELDFFTPNGEPVVLEITWPDDKPRSMGLYMYRESTSATQIRDRLSGGVQSGVEYPSAGGMTTTRHIFYPWTSRYLFEARTMIDGYPAAVASIKAYAINGRLPKLPLLTPVGEDQRLFGHMDEDQTFEIMINGELEQRGPGQKRYLLDPLESLLDYMDYTGQNAMSYPIVRYDFVYKDLPGAYDGTGFLTKGWQQLWLDLFERRGKKLIATINFWALPEDLLAPDQYTEEYALYDRSGNVVGGGGLINPVHPVARQRIMRHIGDVISDLGGHPACAGIKLWFISGRSPWAFHSLEHGYGDYMMGYFEADTGIDLGISDTASNRFELRYQALTGTYRAQWLQWRAAKTTELITQVDTLLQSKNPSLAFYLALGSWGSMVETVSSENEESFNFTNLFYEAYGMDLAALAALPSVRLSTVREPSADRWQKHRDGRDTTANELMWAPDKFATIRATGRAASWSYQRYFESFNASLNNTVYKSNFQNADIKAHGRFFLQELVQALAATDGQAILIGAQPLGTTGRDGYAREFARAYRALPAGAFVDIPGPQDPVVARSLQTANGTYLYFANLSAFPVNGTVSFAGSPACAEDLSTGKSLSITAGDLALDLLPFELRSFRIDGGAAPTSWNVSVSADATAWMQAKFDQVTSLPGSPAGSLPDLTNAIQASIDAGELANAHRLTSSKALRTGAIPPYLSLPAELFTDSSSSSLFISEDWNDLQVEAADTGSLIGWNTGTGIGGTAPFVGSGTLTTTMQGATNGFTQVFSSNLDSYSASGLFLDRYVATTRVNVSQFPDITFSATNGPTEGIVLVDIRRDNRLQAVLTPTSLWVQSAVSNWTEIVAATALNVNYTWQLEVDDAAGTVDVSRRASDASAFTLLASNLPIRNQDAPDQVRVNIIYHNADNTQTQGLLIGDYFTLSGTSQTQSISILYLSGDDLFAAPGSPPTGDFFFQQIAVAPTGNTLTWYSATEFDSSLFKVFRTTSLVDGEWVCVASELPRSPNGTNVWLDANPPTNAAAFYQLEF